MDQVGGDKGGNSFKLTVQLANAEVVKSIKTLLSSLAFKLLIAYQTLINVAISRCAKQIKKLVLAGWKA
jgi:hypothetical protein